MFDFNLFCSQSIRINPIHIPSLIICTLGFSILACGPTTQPNSDLSSSNSSHIEESSPSSSSLPSSNESEMEDEPIDDDSPTDSSPSSSDPTINENSEGVSANPEPNSGSNSDPSSNESSSEMTSPSNEMPSNDMIGDNEEESAQEETSNGELQGNQFINLSDQIIGNPIQRRYGIAISDLDLNGDYEIIVTGYGAPNEVYDYQNGRWIDRAPNSLKDAERRAIGVAACDVDGDGQEEIYFLNVDRFGGLGEVSDRLYMRTGEDSQWIDLFEKEENQTVINQFSGRSVACLDRFGQGKYGIFVANYGGPMKLFELESSESDSIKRLIDVGPDVGINLTTGGRALLALPRQEPGMHLFAGNERGANFLFINQGGTFEEKANDAGISDPQETVRGAATLDVNGDGLFDLVYGNWEGPHRLFIAQSPNESNDFITYIDQTPPAMSVPSRIRTVIAADFDNDGYEELFFNNIGQPNRLFRQSQGEWIQVPLEDALEPEGLGTGAAVVDSNQDGILELWIAHGESGAQPLSLYQWGNQGYHWIRVAPLTSSGGPARGAKVTLYQEGGRVQRRVIDAGSGYLCQMEPVAHFGLGDNTQIDRVEVEWVDGTQINLPTPTVDQVLRVSPPQ